MQSFGYLTREQSRGEGGMYGENIIEVHETPCPPYPENRATDNKVSENRETGNQTELNNKKINNQRLNNKRLTNQSIHQKNKKNGRDMIETYLDIVKENIEYEYLLRENPYKKDIIDEILNLIVETVSIQRKNIRIAGTDYSYELVKEKFLKLNSGHIQYVLSCMEKNTTKVRKKNIIINNRVTPEDRDIIYKRIELSGLTIQDYITQCCKYGKATAVGNVKTFDAIRREMKVIDEHLCRIQRADELDLQVLESLRAILEILDGFYREEE